jgi:hypothetical protein
MMNKRPIALSTLLIAGAVLSSSRVEAQGFRQMLQERMQQQNQSVQPSPQQSQSMPQGYGSGQPVPTPEVSVVNLRTQPGSNGQQMVVTPKGMVVPLPGAGVNGSTVPIYIGGNGGFWYVDRYGQQVDLTPAVRAMQASASYSNMAAPQGAPPQQTVINNNTGSGSGSSAAGTAAMAGLGAMTGALVGNAIDGNNSVPYGTPVHYASGYAPYYNQGGKPVYVNNSTKTADVNQANVYHPQSLQQQQEWYHQQQAQQTSNWKNWQQQPVTNNPFVRSESQEQPLNQKAAGAAEPEEKSRGRFSRRHGESEASSEDKNTQRHERSGRLGRRR